MKQECDSEMRSEYKFDYSTAVRGKYARRILREGANVALLDPDIAKAFPDSASVNDALRSLLTLAEAAKRRNKRSARPRRTKPRRPTPKNE